jgi:hypothetical protein
VIQIVEALKAVTASLEIAEVEYVIVGSVAASAWGVARTTRDVDMVAMLRSEDLARLIESLDLDHFYIPVEDARRSVREGGSFNVLHPESGGKVDVFVGDPSNDFTRSTLRRRVRESVFGLSLWVATAEDVILAKLRWRLQTRSEVQWRDCTEIAGSQALDRSYLRLWAPELGVLEDLEQLLAGVDFSSS